MKTNNLFIAGMAAMALLVASCSNDDDAKVAGNGEKAAITIRLKGETALTKATGPTTDDQTDEQKVHNFKVYVFNAGSGELEAAKDGSVNSSGEAQVTRIEDLNTASAKHIVVLANRPDRYPELTNYSQLTNMNIDLGTQAPNKKATGGLAMSGEAANLVLNSGDQTVPVTIRRVVAKIELAAITIRPDENSTGSFELKGVSIQKAKQFANFGPTTILSSSPFLGGLAGSESALPGSDNYLFDMLATPPANVQTACDNYFYVHPNEVSGEETLLTIAGLYNGKETYFPFRINDKIGSSNTDGSLIQRNTRYVLNVTLKKLGSGSDNPDVPGDPAAIDVEVSTEGWAGPIIQDVEW